MNIKDYYGVRDVGDVEVGIEIEMEGRNLHQDSVKGWTVVGDGSLRGEAVEYVLKKPIKRKEIGLLLNRLWTNTKQWGAEFVPSDRCGVHIHVNCQELTFKQTFNFIILYLMLEDVLVKWCGEGRPGNMFCLRAKDAEWLVYALVKDRTAGALDMSTDRDGMRYASLNISALKKYGSLEFRALASPTEWKIVETWAKLLLSLKDIAIATDDPRDFISSCSVQGPTEWAKGILGEYYDMLSYPDMEEDLMEGARRVQMLAYSKLGEIPERVQAAMVDEFIRMQVER